MQRMSLSKEQHEKLKQEVHQLKFVERPKAIKAVATAREHGDLRENAEYEAAKEKQKILEGKIARLEEMLATARIIEQKDLVNDRVRLGSRVTVEDLKHNEQITYELVPSAEFSPDDVEAISISSPVGKALLGKMQDEIVEIKVPAGIIKYRIIKIS